MSSRSRALAVVMDSVSWPRQYSMSAPCASREARAGLAGLAGDGAYRFNPRTLAHIARSWWRVARASVAIASAVVHTGAPPLSRRKAS